MEQGSGKPEEGPAASSVLRKAAGPACVRCGQCMSVCPVYGVTREETDVARGRMELFRLLDQKGISPESLAQASSRCLLCGACESVCAAGVRVREKTVEARSRGVRTDYPAAEKMALAALTRDSEAARGIRRAGRLFTALFAGEIEQTSGLYLRFPASFFLNRKVVPRIAARPFTESFARRAQAKSETPRVAFFTGCGANHIFTDTSWAVARLSNFLDIPLAVPKNQGCCGLAAYSTGRRDLFLSCVEKNLAAFHPERYDTILFVCASCLDHVRRTPELMGKSHPLYEKSLLLAEKAADATSFFAQRFDGALRREPLPTGVASLRVHIHEPCHTRLGKAGPDHTRSLLAAMGPSVSVISGIEPSCCGHGGSFNACFGELSLEIAEPYAREILEAAPDAIVTGCTGCLLQLTEAAFRFSESKIPRITHPLALAAPLLTAK
ncbi:MAG: (Fe-S)-binding protein [Thermodesulfobacteriota bacterium]